jgi:hypothetical protein
MIFDRFLQKRSYAKAAVTAVFQQVNFVKLTATKDLSF